MNSRFELSPDVWRDFLEALEESAIPAKNRPYFPRWLRLYLSFCARGDRLLEEDESLSGFVLHLSEIGYSSFRQQQAAQAVSIFWRVRCRVKHSFLEGFEEGVGCGEKWDEVCRQLKRRIETLQYSRNTYKTYAHWLRRFQEFLQGCDPDEVRAADAAKFFTFLASVKRVTASTQNQAFNALLFVFRHIWNREFEGFEGVARARASNYIPVILSRAEVMRVIGRLKHPFDLMVMLMYGCGLRLFECVSVRVSSLNLEEGVLTVRDGKGKKDRTVPLPVVLMPQLVKQVRRVQWLLGKDRERGFSGVFLPDALSRKFRAAARDLPWQWLFPAPKLTYLPQDDEWRRYHAHEKRLGAAIREAAREAGLTKRVTAHAFRHSFACHLLQANFDIRTIQALLGHSDLRTTMIYTQTVKLDTIKEPKSPLDF